MKVSIIIPYSGEKKYVQDCLESLEAQTCKDFEAIVVCDHCDESEKAAVTEFDVSFPLTVLDTGEKRGVAAARNIGLHASGQEYVFFMDCDDFLDREVVEKMLAAADGQDIVYVNRYYSWLGYHRFQEVRKLPDGEKEKDTYISVSRIDHRDKTLPPLLEGMSAWETLFYHLLRRGKRLSGLSALNLLIRRDLLVSNRILFDESYTYNTDLTFLTKALCACNSFYEQEEGPYYVKRRHNDPINLPSLGQKKDAAVKAQETMEAYLQVKELVKGKSALIETCIDSRFIKDYVKQNLAVYTSDAQQENIEKIRALADRCLPLISEQALELASPYSQKMVKYSQGHTTAEIARKVKRHGSYMEIKKTLSNLGRLRSQMYRKYFLKRPVNEKRILFESFLGKNYSDSPKYIFEYLSKHYPKEYQCIWVLNRKTKLPYPAKQIRRFSLRYFYYMATSKYFVFNGRQPMFYTKRKGQVFLETWHGTPLKRLVFDQVEVTAATPLYKEQVYTQSRCWDYLIAPNKFSSDIFRRCFMYDKEMLETGYPRNDILHLPEEEKSRKVNDIKEQLGLPMDKKVILYAPTWRDNEFYDKGKYHFTLQLDLKKMQQVLGDDYVVVMRTHYFIADILDFSEYEGFVYNASSYDDIAHLYLIADLLITDYSSVFFDYANLRRPLIFFMYDIEQYRDTMRGFYIDIEKELPGPILQTSDEVIDAIRDLPRLTEIYEEKYQAFYEKYCGWENGTSTEKVVQAVFQKQKS